MDEITFRRMDLIPFEHIQYRIDEYWALGQKDRCNVMSEKYLDLCLEAMEDLFYSQRVSQF